MKNQPAGSFLLSKSARWFEHLFIIYAVSNPEPSLKKPSTLSRILIE